MKARKRIAWFSPLTIDPKAEGTISAYASERLLPLLRDRYEIELFYPGAERHPDFPTHHFLKAWDLHRKDPYDIFFYQLEDSLCANFVRMHIGLIPGIVWFHDLMFSSDGPEPILNSPWEETVRKYLDPHRPWPDREREYKRLGPLGYREAGYALVSLFSNLANHIDYKNQVSLKLNRSKESSFYLPVPVRKRFELVHEPRTRREIIFAGSPRIEHRAHKVLGALAQLKEDYSLTWLIEPEEKSASDELLKEFEVTTANLVLGRSPANWERLVQRGGIAIHTLFSVYGQPGPYLEISLMAGLPVIVTNFASTEYLPDSVLFKVQPGETESVEIRESVRAIIRGEVFFSPERVREFAIENYSAQKIADELSLMFERCEPRIRQALALWQWLERDAREAVLGELLGADKGDLALLKSREVALQSVIQPICKELGWVDG